MMQILFRHILLRTSISLCQHTSIKRLNKTLQCQYHGPDIIMAPNRQESTQIKWSEEKDVELVCLTINYLVFYAFPENVWILMVLDGNSS